jgi:predicted flavoprotein YhiN
LVHQFHPTFEAKTIPWLYGIGECLNVTGKTGGFNLQRCRTSGAICGKALNH